MSEELSAARPGQHSTTPGREPQCFAAFEILWLKGEDLRRLPLLERKRRLRPLLPLDAAALFVDHIPGEGVSLFRSVCARDLEGIVAKRADGLYTPEETSWVKIKNRHYSQSPSGMAGGSCSIEGERGARRREPD
jgi:ATP-dependent DNA ligase